MPVAKRVFDYAVAMGSKGSGVNLDRHREPQRQLRDRTNRVAEDARTSEDNRNTEQVGAVGAHKSSS